MRRNWDGYWSMVTFLFEAFEPTTNNNDNNNNKIIFEWVEQSITKHVGVALIILGYVWFLINLKENGREKVEEK